MAAALIPRVNIAAAIGVGVFVGMSLLGMGMVYASRRTPAKRKDEVNNAIKEHTLYCNDDKQINKDRTSRLNQIKNLIKNVTTMKEQLEKLPIEEPKPEKDVQAKK